MTEGTSTKIDVCAAGELPDGQMRLVETPDGVKIGVFNCDGELYAIEDRCSHDEGPLAEGEEARAIAWARTVLAAASRVAS